MALEVRKADDRIVVVDSDLPEILDGDPEATYTLRTLTTAKIDELRRPYEKKEFNKRTHRAELVPLTRDEELAYALDCLDYALVDWTGVLYGGEPLACVREHKVLLDGPRKAAILAVAGMNKAGAQQEAAQQASFRPTVDV